ncbi:hypothetical protein STEG23_036153, partial [Scotinomys teguina]
TEAPPVLVGAFDETHKRFTFLSEEGSGSTPHTQFLKLKIPGMHSRVSSIRKSWNGQSGNQRQAFQLWIKDVFYYCLNLFDMAACSVSDLQIHLLACTIINYLASSGAAWKPIPVLLEHTGKASQKCKLRQVPTSQVPGREREKAVEEDKFPAPVLRDPLITFIQPQGDAINYPEIHPSTSYSL